MIKHIVFFKLKSPDNAIKKEIEKRLLSLKNSIDVLNFIEVGINFSKEDRAYDISLITEFDSEEALKIYAEHPLHLEVVSYIKSVCQSTKVVDYKLK